MLPFVNGRDIVCGFLQYWHVKCNLLLTYDYSACLLIAKICSLISLYIVNHQECFKKITTTKIFTRNNQLWTRLVPSFLIIRRGFVRCNFIGHQGWNGRESTNQIRQYISHIDTLYILFHCLLIHNFSRLLLGFGLFKHFSLLSPARDGIFVFLPSSRMSRVS